MEIEVALALWNAESAGTPSFKPTSNGILIRFENHILWKQWGVNNQTEFNKHFYPQSGASLHRICVPETCKPFTEDDTGWKLIHLTSAQPVYSQAFQDLQYEALNLAVNKGGNDAYLAISMGGPQILGTSHSLVASVTDAQDMYTKFSVNEINQIIGFFEFMEKKEYPSGGKTAIEWAINHNNNFDGLARAYNGDSSAAVTYAQEICTGYNVARQLFNKSVVGC